MAAIPSETLRRQWLEHALPLAGQMGWTQDMMDQSAQSAGLNAGEKALSAPGGVADLIDQFFNDATDDMLAKLAIEDLDALRVHERIASGIAAFLEGLEPHRGAVRKAAQRGLLPWGAPSALNRVWAISDAIWEAAGDTATDYNRQTKRLLLSTVIPRVILYWLDHEDDPEAVKAHTMSCLKQAMKLGQTGGKVFGPVLNALSSIRSRSA